MICPKCKKETDVIAEGVCPACLKNNSVQLNKFNAKSRNWSVLFSLLIVLLLAIFALWTLNFSNNEVVNSQIFTSE